MKNNEFVKDLSSRTTKILNQIKSCGDNVFDKRVIEKIFRSLPKTFKHIVVVIEKIEDLSRLTIHELIGSLEAHEQEVTSIASNQWINLFRSKKTFLIGRQQDFIKIKKEKDHFSEKKYMEEQVKVRLTMVEVEVEEEEEHIFI